MVGRSCSATLAQAANNRQAWAAHQTHAGQALASVSPTATAGNASWRAAMWPRGRQLAGQRGGRGCGGQLAGRLLVFATAMGIVERTRDPSLHLEGEGGGSPVTPEDPNHLGDALPRRQLPEISDVRGKCFTCWQRFGPSLKSTGSQAAPA